MSTESLKLKDHISTVRRTLLGISAAALLTCSLSAAGQMTGKDAPGKGTAPHAHEMNMPMSADMKESMMRRMKEMQSMPMTGDADHDFAMMMKMHHQHGVEMAQMQLKSGKDAKMRSMAKHIVSAQQKEIKEFDQWLAKHPGAHSKHGNK